MNIALQQLVALARRFPVVFGSILVCLLLGGANYYLRDRQRVLTLHHEEVRRNGEAMLLSLTTHPRITAQLNTVKEALELIDRNLVVESDLAENLGYFYQIETLSRIRLSQLSQLSSQPSPEGNPYKAVPFSLRVVGSYSQIVGLLRELETGPRLLRVKACNLVRSDLKTNAMTMDLTVELLGGK